MDEEKKRDVCSSNNKCMQTILGNIKGCRFYSESLKHIINGYYDIYQTAHNSFNDFKSKIMDYYNGKSKEIFRNMVISNIEKDENNLYSFELVSDYPVSFRLPFTFNAAPSEHYSKFNYAGKEKDNIYYLIMGITFSDNDLATLENALSSFIKINKNYIFEMVDDLPYVLCIDHNHVSICNANDESNNIVALVDIDLEEETLTFHESIANNEFTAMFKDYLLLILENAYVKESEVSKKIGCLHEPKNGIIDRLLIKYNMIGKPVKKEEPAKELFKEPSGRMIYLVYVSDEGYKPIVDYRSVDYIKEENCYRFKFDDSSMLFVPASSMLIVDGNYEQAKTSEAYKEFKKLTRRPPKKDKE